MNILKCFNKKGVIMKKKKIQLIKTIAMIMTLNTTRMNQATTAVQVRKMMIIKNQRKLIMKVRPILRTQIVLLTLKKKLRMK